jgi:hypothetical protein
MILRVPQSRGRRRPGSVLALPASRRTGRRSVLGAFDAYRAGDPIKLAKHAKKLDGHLLAPWLEYWRCRCASRMRRAPGS